MVMFFRAKECSQSFWRRSSVIVLSMSISYLSRASVWTWVTHKLLVSSVILLIWIWAAEGTNKMRVRLLYSTAAGVFANCSNFWTSDELWRTCRSCIFKWWILMSLLKVWLTAPTVQFTSSRFSLSLFSSPDVSLRVKEIKLSCWPNYSLMLWGKSSTLSNKRTPYLSILAAEPCGGSGHLWAQTWHVPISGAAQRGQPVVQLHQIALRLQGVSLDAPHLHL